MRNRQRSRFHHSATLAFILLLAIGRMADGGTLAQFRTLFGDLEVELYDEEKPVTSDNFKRLTQAGAFQNTFLHRLVPGFVVQGGGFFVISPPNTSLFAPPWNLLGTVPNFGPITNEFETGSFLSNTNGTIAMAKTGANPDSATSQWFFNLGDNSANLDNQNGGFTVFGRVVRDTGPTNTGGLLGLFKLVSYGDGLVNMSWWYPTNSLATNLFTHLPVTYSGLLHPRYADLFYVDVTLLSVQIALTNTMREISWNSVSDRPNVVEYTTNMPPVWWELATTNGSGARITLTDPAATNESRFYRVRVDY